MAESKRLSSIMLVVGIIVLVISILADFAGIGRAPGMGPNQIMGVIVGGVVTIIGVIKRLKK
jgi:hypothetical protein